MEPQPLPECQQVSAHAVWLTESQPNWPAPSSVCCQGMSVVSSGISGWPTQPPRLSQGPSASLRVLPATPLAPCARHSNKAPEHPHRGAGGKDWRVDKWTRLRRVGHETAPAPRSRCRGREGPAATAEPSGTFLHLLPGMRGAGQIPGGQVGDSLQVYKSQREAAAADLATHPCLGMRALCLCRHVWSHTFQIIGKSLDTCLWPQSGRGLSKN